MLEVISCQQCDKDLVSKLEKNIKLCFDCVLINIRDFKELQKLFKLQEEEIIRLKEANSILLSVKQHREVLESSFNAGKEAFRRGFTIEDDLNIPDSEESTMWKSGWLEEARLAEYNEMQDFIRWDMNLWIHINELVANGCNLDELEAKTKLAPIKAMKFLPEFLEDEK